MHDKCGPGKQFFLATQNLIVTTGIRIERTQKLKMKYYAGNPLFLSTPYTCCLISKLLLEIIGSRYTYTRTMTVGLE